MKGITTIMEDYHNILNVLMEPTVPDISEPDVILGDGEHLTLSSSEN